MVHAAGRFPWGQKGVDARAEPRMEPMGLGSQAEQAVWGEWQGVKACLLGGVNRGLASRMKKVISSLVCSDWVSQAHLACAPGFAPSPLAWEASPSPGAIPPASGLLLLTSSCPPESCLLAVPLCVDEAGTVKTNKPSLEASSSSLGPSILH